MSRTRPFPTFHVALCPFSAASFSTRFVLSLVVLGNLCASGTGPTDSQPTSIACPPGTFSATPPPPAAASFDECLACPAGTYSSSPGQTSCTPCAIDLYSAARSALCPFSSASCPAGTFASAPASCLPCPPGAYNPTPGQSSCRLCSAGTFGISVGAVQFSETCRPCAAGAYSDAGASLCAYTAATCPAGTYSSAPSSCTSCAPGNYSATVGAAACLVCPPGSRSSNLLGSTECVHCVRGSGSAAGSAECATCDGGVCVAALVDPYVATVAGGVKGYVNGVGTGARFDDLWGISAAMAPSSPPDVYAFDRYRLRRVNPAGAVTTVAGKGVYEDPPRDGIGTTASFSISSAYTVMGALGLYIADGTRVRLFDAASNTVSTLAELPFEVSYIAVNSSGTVFAFDEPRNCICYLVGTECVLAAGGGTSDEVQVTPLASPLSSRAGSSSPTRSPSAPPEGAAPEDTNGTQSASGGPAPTAPAAPASVPRGHRDGWGAAVMFQNVWGMVFSTDGLLIIIDGTRVRRMNASFFVDTLAGGAPGRQPGILDGVGSSAQLFFLTAMAADSVGGVYVADSLQTDPVNGAYGNCIRQVSRDGVVTTLAGDCAAVVGSYSDGAGAMARFNYIYGLAVDRFDGIWVSDGQNFAIRLVGAGTCTYAVAFGSPSSTGGFLDSDGPTQVGAEFSSPFGISFVSAAAAGLGAGGGLFIVDRGNFRVRLADIESGEVSTLAGDGSARCEDGVGTAASFLDPS